MGVRRPLPVYTVLCSPVGNTGKLTNRQLYGIRKLRLLQLLYFAKIRFPASLPQPLYKTRLPDDNMKISPFHGGGGGADI